MKQYTITVNGNTYNVTVEENKSGSPVVQPTRIAQQEKASAPAPAANAGGVRIECPMSGKILAVKVSQGQAVKKGEPLMILEAMKMENEIVATEDGVVASINCSEGQAVESGQILATLS